MKQIILTILVILSFQVKILAETPTITFTSNKAVGDLIGFSLSTSAAGTTFKVDFGNGTLINYTMPLNPKRIEGSLMGDKTVKIYCNGITGIDCRDLAITSLSVSNATSLENLICIDNSLTSLDITNNTELFSVTASNNKLNSLSIETNTKLTNLNCHYNNITSINTSKNALLQYFSCSNNQITQLNLSSNNQLKELVCSNNKITSINTAPNNSLTKIKANNNNINAINLFNTPLLTYLDISNNNFSFESLPLGQSQWTTYNYNDQKELPIPQFIAIGESIDLKKQLQVDNTSSTFEWRLADNALLQNGFDYTIASGVTNFIKPQTQKLYAIIKNSKLPNVTLKTSETLITSTTAIDNKSLTETIISTKNGSIIAELTGASSIKIYDITGKIIASKMGYEGINTIEINSPGIYIINITSNKNSLTKKVIIK